jgi:hypothetical protein
VELVIVLSFGQFGGRRAHSTICVSRVVPLKPRAAFTVAEA